MKATPTAKLAWILLASLGLASCPDKGPLEKAGEAVDDAAEEAGEVVEEAVDEVEDAVE